MLQELVKIIYESDQKTFNTNEANITHQTSSVKKGVHYWAVDKVKTASTSYLL
jgi:hypothetical protein